ncbi:MAG: hypothetical protein HONBIEJF_01107 [Fimbriimonadaceae bacterium]|nr:hypothetical protein [Fimbriimonadaceae bacterium]
MNLREELKFQYHSGLEMLTECIRRCPEDLWIAPNPPNPVAASPDNPDWNGVERPFWRIAFHNVYFTHLYLGQNEAAFMPPPAALTVRSRPDFEAMWHAPWALEPYELVTAAHPVSRDELLEYLHFVDGLVDATVDGLDLEHPASGFELYPGFTKIGHQLLNLRHLMGHVGQLSELLMLRGTDIEWR